MQMEKLEHIFREYDIRGIMDTEITEDFVCGLGFVLADFFKSHKHRRILLGHDTRRNSRLYHDILADVLSRCGLHVVSLGQIPTPCLYFGVHCLRISAGIMVTASHNPAKYNGFKIWNNKTTLSGDEIKQFFSAMQKFFHSLGRQGRNLSSLMQEQPKNQGFISFHNIIPSYAEKVCENMPPLNCSVLIDGANGAAGRLCADVFRRSGADVQELFCDYAEDFPNHKPDPTKAKNMRKLTAMLKQGNFKYGIGLDGDGDRVMLADKNGRMLQSDELMSIFVRDFCRKKQNPLFLLDVKCSERLVQDIADQNGSYRFMPTGHSLLKKGMLCTDADFGGEFSGHFFHSENWYKTDDGILTALRAIAILEKNNLDLTKLPEWEQRVAGEEIGIACTKEQKQNINERVTEFFAKKYGQKAACISIDGIRCVFDDAWFLVRASQTSEQIILRFEAKTEEKYHALKNCVLADLEKILQS